MPCQLQVLHAERDPVFPRLYRFSVPDLLRVNALVRCRVMIQQIGRGPFIAAEIVIEHGSCIRINPVPFQVLQGKDQQCFAFLHACRDHFDPDSGFIAAHPDRFQAVRVFFPLVIQERIDFVPRVCQRCPCRHSQQADYHKNCPDI